MTLLGQWVGDQYVADFGPILHIFEKQQCTAGALEIAVRKSPIVALASARAMPVRVRTANSSPHVWVETTTVTPSLNDDNNARDASIFSVSLAARLILAA